MRIVYKISSREAKEAYRLLNKIDDSIEIEIEDAFLSQPVGMGGLVRAMELNNTATYRNK